MQKPKPIIKPIFYVPGATQPQRGAALITVLLIVALIATAGILMHLQQAFNIHRTQQMLAMDQSFFYADAVTEWARGVLYDNAAKRQSEMAIKDHLPVQFPGLQQATFGIEGELSDMQGRFNLNNLIDQQYITHFIRLLHTVEPGLDTDTAEEIAHATHAWVSKPKRQTEQESFDYDALYLQQSPPYRSPHRPMASPSELRLVAGMTGELYSKLQPFITALPGMTKTNINTASATVLTTLGEVSLSAANDIISARNKKAFASVAEFMQRDDISRYNLDDQNLTVVSDYFLVSTSVNQQNNQYLQYVLLKRGKVSQDSDKKITIDVLWSQQQTW